MRRRWRRPKISAPIGRLGGSEGSVERWTEAVGRMVGRWTIRRG